MENRLRLIEDLAHDWPLWGNGAKAVLQVRHVMLLRRALESGGIPFPEMRFSFENVPTDGSWLVKPSMSARGRGIEFWRGQFLDFRSIGFLQRYVPWPSCSALFVSNRDGAHLVGVTQQLVGESWLNAAAFHYCGSIGPVRLERSQELAYWRIGDTLNRTCGLRGLFGVDCVVNDGVPWVIEVNPRYTASAEVIELATGQATISWHECAFENWAIPPLCDYPVNACIGKAILFARKPIVFPDSGPWNDALTIPPTEFRPFADIPQARSEVAEGRPVMSFFAKSTSPEECRTELKRTAAELDRRLFGA
jgi:predicted ATP-grasp superfamily ATP-dependent carboligase